VDSLYPIPETNVGTPNYHPNYHFKPAQASSQHFLKFSDGVF